MSTLRPNSAVLRYAVRAAVLGALAYLTVGGVPVNLEATGGPSRDTLRVAEVVAVDSVWSGLPVEFALLTHADRQFVAYYDHERHLTVAARPLDSDDWTRVRLDERVPWDSHNYLTMAVDANDQLHLSGNMHVDPLTYFRTEEPLDIRTLERVEDMVGRDEEQCTYPTFLKGPDGRLVFGYRDGGSGDGRRIYNVYDAEAEQWRRLLDTPLLDGGPQDMNAYPIGPTRGPDGRFHVVWMWRNTPDAATNHDLSYMRSADLRHWETAGGTALSLPVTPADSAAVVDPAGPGEGLINMGFALGFDHQNRPVVGYHRYDDAGHSQIYNARWERGAWQIHQTSDWSVRWDFGGMGSLPSRVGAGAARPVGAEAGAEGRLAQPYWHWKQGEGAWLLDPKTLQPVGQTVLDPPRPAHVDRVRSDVPGMRVQWTGDVRREADGRGRRSVGRSERAYQLRWETLGRNRDRPRTDTVPPPSTLEVYAFTDSTASSRGGAERR